MKTFETGIDLLPESGSVTVTVTLSPEGPSQQSAPVVQPPSDPNPTPPTAPPESAPPSGDTSTTTFWSPVRIGGFVVGGAGLIATAAGIGIGVSGVSKANAATDAFNAAEAKHPPDVAGENTALVDHAAGHNQGVGGWITTGIGSAALLTGIIMIAAAPRKATVTTSFLIAPWADASSKGMFLRGAF